MQVIQKPNESGRETQGQVMGRQGGPKTPSVGRPDWLPLTVIGSLTSSSLRTSQGPASCVGGVNSLLLTDDASLELGVQESLARSRS